MEAGAGKQNAVVVIVVRRYAGLVRIVGCFAVSEDLTKLLHSQGLAHMQRA
jgi:hypothetical protein